MWILGGSVFEKNGDNQPYNTSMLIAPDGTLVAKYRKAHLYDVAVPGSVPVQESANMAHGDKPVLVNTEELGNLGLTICYDVRFPEIYRLLALAGAEVFFVPADFGFRTGRAHRELLLRARAVENGCYVIAPQQCHKKSCGETMIIDPWGEVLAKMDMESGVITAEIDTDRVHSTQESLGLFTNRRTDLYDIRWKTGEVQ
jgi:predicted amidohydrolase